MARLCVDDEIIHVSVGRVLVVGEGQHHHYHIEKSISIRKRTQRRGRGHYARYCRLQMPVPRSHTMKTDCCELACLG